MSVADVRNQSLSVRATLRLYYLCLVGVIVFMTLMTSIAFLKATPESLTQSDKKLEDPVKAASKNSSKHWVKAQPSFFERRAEGWHWYEEGEREDEEKPLKQKTPNASPSLTPTEKIEAQRKVLEQKLHTAIVTPTRENVISYIIAQKGIMDQSQRFSEAWKQVVLTVPSLDETFLHPVDQNARHVYYGEKNKELTSRIKALAQEYGLFFFFRKNCPYCHHFAPIVKHFAEKHSWSVLAISLDGGTLSEFPHARRNNGIAERLHVSHVPALMALHPQSGQTIPLAYGLVSESEIEERVDLLTRVRTYPLGENP